MTNEEYKLWYESVDFIQDFMQFYSFNDFVEHSLKIKSFYLGLPRQARKLYQWYVFAGSLSYSHKQVVWDFVNGVMDYTELLRHKTISDNYKYMPNQLEQRNNSK